MHALVVDDDPAARLAIEGALGKAGYKTELAADAQTAWPIFERTPPHVVLVDGGLPGSGALELVRRIRRAQSAEHIYVVVGLDRTGADLPAAYAAGADDVIRKPYGRDELVARVDGVRRLRQVLAKAGASVALDWSEGLRVTSLAAWKDLDAVITVDLEEMLGACAKASAPQQGTAGCTCAEIPLSLPTENIQIRLRVAFDAGSVERGAKKLLGADVSPDLHSDFVREIANVAAGSLRRQAQKEGVLLTMGLPCDVEPDPASAGGQRASRKFQVGFEGNIIACFDVEVFARAPEILQLASVREGMVLAREIVSPAGALLLPAGTRMTATAIGRVTQLLGARYQVEVADARGELESRCA